MTKQAVKQQKKPKKVGMIIDPKGKTDEEIANEMIAFLDKHAPLPEK